MVDFYIKMINNNKMTLDEVPDLWREQVREALEDQPDAHSASAKRR